MDKLEEMTKLIKRFRDERDWKKFHTSRNLAESISLEASEILELFQWDQTPTKERLEEEISDVLAYVLSLADVNNIDVYESFKSKMKKNEIKYPIENKDNYFK